MISIEVVKPLLDILLVVLLFIQRRKLKTDQERLEFIVSAVVSIAVLSL